jgi:hypothetical protein
VLLIHYDVAWIHNIPNFPNLRFFGVFRKESDNIICANAHRSIASLQYRSQSFQYIFHDLQAYTFLKASLFFVSEILLKSFIVFSDVVHMEGLMLLFFDYFDNVRSWKFEMVRENALIVLKRLFNFLVSELIEGVYFCEVVISDFSGTLDFEDFQKWKTCVSFLSGELKIRFIHVLFIISF